MTTHTATHNATPIAPEPPAPLSTSTPADSPGIDLGRVEAFVGRMLTDFAGAAGTVMTVLGDRLGLYAAMTGAGRITAAELASRTNLHPRLVAEWLASQTVAGYVDYHPADDAYEFPIEHAMALAVTDSPAYIIGAAEIIAGQYATLPDLERAFGGDGGIDYTAFPGSVACGIERFFRTAYRSQLADAWFPTIDGLIDSLAAGARVADVGCGHGAASQLIAQRWPAATVTGFDTDQKSITIARARQIEAGSPANLEFRIADATEIGPGPYEVITFFDALHDLGDPRAALRRAHDLLVPGGHLVVVAPWSADQLNEGIDNPIARIDWSVSTSLCTPTSLAQPVGYALGNQGGPTIRLQLCSEPASSTADSPQTPGTTSS